jgi:RNA polymerase sigma factor (sigma-70 family)
VSVDQSFLDLVALVRSGNQDAATELVRRFEPAIRRAVKMQLRDHRLRAALDSMDVCQSVLANFFVRAALGQFELQTPEDLLKLLATMARNNVATRARRNSVKKRDPRPFDANELGDRPLLAPGDSPSQIAAGLDLVQAVRQRLTIDERTLAEQRAEGLDWNEIALARGCSSDAVRKKFTRALGRVVRELGLEESAIA